MRRTNAPTLQTIADAAGVSIMAASVVLNGAQSSTRVSAETRERLLDIAAQLQYRRNAVARGLSRQRMDTLGVTAAIVGDELNLYIMEVLNGILEAAAAHTQNTTVFSLSDWNRDAAKLAEYCDGRVDGMILIAPEIIAPEMLSPHTPFVTIHGSEEFPNTYNLDVDNEGGAYEVTRFLISHGHRNIVHFPGNKDVLGAQQRITGFCRALREARLPFDESQIVEGSFSIRSGRRRAAALLERATASLPTAIFCGSDAIACGCIEVLAGHGLRVPEDISIAGFDDSLMARMTRPALTTVSQPFRQMGRCAVETLLSLINGDDPLSEDAAPGGSEDEFQRHNRVRIFPAALVVRESVGPPPAQPAYAPDEVDRRWLNG